MQSIRYVLVLFIFIIPIKVRSQVGIELCGNYRYNVIAETVSCYNLGGEIFLSKDINRNKVQIGMGYQSKNFTKNNFDGFREVKTNYQLQYLSFVPALIHVKLKETSDYNFSVFGGLGIHTVIGYKIWNHDTTVKNPSAGQGISSSCRFGFSYSRKFNLVNVSCSPFVEYKIIVDSIDDYSHVHYDILDCPPVFDKTIPQDRFSFGITVGIEYKLSKP